MRDGRSSKTAEQNALFRALETRHSAAPRPMADPLAPSFLGFGLASVARVARSRTGHRLVVGFIDRRWPGVRSSVVARTRLIDDLLAELAPATAQTVLLGAGFDSRPYRLACLRGRRVFEVDHPATQARKHGVLERGPIDADHVRFVPTDFRIDDLGASLAAAGFDRKAPTVFVWEGVTNYLSEPAVDATLRWCAGAAPGSQLVFTYVDQRVLTDPSGYLGAERVLATSRRAGESVTFGMPPEDVPGYLRARGLRLLADTGATDYRAAYYGPAGRSIRGHEFYRVAHACVQPTG